MKSGDILVNSLGILAFVTPGAEGNTIEWDPLADWLYKQQNEDGTFQTALVSHFEFLFDPLCFLTNLLKKNDYQN